LGTVLGESWQEVGRWKRRLPGRSERAKEKSLVIWLPLPQNTCMPPELT
jgi:hypothetical protein